ncbi:hypothetical protein BLNAU_25044 [Blattamonas nauphoetae]|uniref:Uncharacterized protein n=1 Tax=Blattamonas nauphoetae TaxID=2049346 RepID=A0ABQ9WL24_9EUKA|nr:hypothetical protein BLNAU_25044 [Blattamonas nauphoetae]
MPPMRIARFLEHLESPQNESEQEQLDSPPIVLRRFTRSAKFTISKYCHAISQRLSVYQMMNFDEILIALGEEQRTDIPDLLVSLRHLTAGTDDNRRRLVQHNMLPLLSQLLMSSQDEGVIYLVLWILSDIEQSDVSPPSLTLYARRSDFYFYGVLIYRTQMPPFFPPHIQSFPQLAISLLSYACEGLSSGYCAYTALNQVQTRRQISESQKKALTIQSSSGDCDEDILKNRVVTEISNYFHIASNVLHVIGTAVPGGASVAGLYLNVGL